MPASRRTFIGLAATSLTATGLAARALGAAGVTAGLPAGAPSRRVGAPSAGR